VAIEELSHRLLIFRGDSLHQYAIRGRLFGIVSGRHPAAMDRMMA